MWKSKPPVHGNLCPHSRTRFGSSLGVLSTAGARLAEGPLHVVLIIGALRSPNSDWLPGRHAWGGPRGWQPRCRSPACPAPFLSSSPPLRGPLPHPCSRLNPALPLPSPVTRAHSEPPRAHGRGGGEEVGCPFRCTWASAAPCLSPNRASSSFLPPSGACSAGREWCVDGVREAPNNSPALLCLALRALTRHLSLSQGFLGPHPPPPPLRSSS